MEAKIYLRASSLSASIQFYIAELQLFEIDEVAEDELYASMRPIGNKEVVIELSAQYGPPSQQSLFTIGIDCCDTELERLSSTAFASGGRVVPDKHGNLAAFEWPGGKSFMVEDPAGNRFVLEEDYTQGAEK